MGEWPEELCSEKDPSMFKFFMDSIAKNWNNEKLWAFKQ